MAFLVVPVFGFANAGISFANVALSDALAPLPLGIAVALVIGKQAAVFGTIFILVRLGLAHLPSQVSWRHIYGVALLCGIGFTISLFIGGLAFDGNPERVNAVKIGVFSGSLLSGLIGYAILRSGRKPQERAR